MQEVHGLFLDFFLRTSSVLQSDQESKVTAWELPDPEEKCCVTIEEWLDVWGFLVGEAKKINDLPMWLQYYPKTLFDTINRSGSENHLVFGESSRFVGKDRLNVSELFCDIQRAADNASVELF